MAPAQVGKEQAMAMTQPDLALGVGVRTEQGRRDDNQDKMTAFATPMGTFYIVADGMGGHRGGAEASHRVVEGYRNHLNHSLLEGADIAETLQQATSLTNAEILAESRGGDPSVSGMGSTVVMALLKSTPTGMEMMTAHIGDSRAYLMRGGVLHRLTRDHSAVQRMVDEELITPEMAVNHPDLNILTRAIGKQPEVAVEVGKIFELYPGDSVLLCTDGLWGPLQEDQIVQELSADRTAQETADSLVERALEAGSDDNITVQVIRLESRTLPTQSFPAQLFPPPAGAIGGSRSGRKDATQPFSPASGDAPWPAEASAPAAPSQLAAMSPSKAPSQSGASTKRSPLVLVVAGTALGLLLAGGVWFSYAHFHRVPTPPPPPVIPHDNCASASSGGVCKPVPAAPLNSVAPPPARKKTPCPAGEQPCPAQKKKHSAPPSSEQKDQSDQRSSSRPASLPNPTANEGVVQ